jgi:hypothetical protein
MERTQPTNLCGLKSQYEFVEDCLGYYRKNGIEQGNPDHGTWDKCHYPAPKCLGGKNTIMLLKEHHAVQGVLQSEEYCHPCIFGWEKNFFCQAGS